MTQVQLFEILTALYIIAGSTVMGKNIILCGSFMLTACLFATLSIVYAILQ